MKKIISIFTLVLTIVLSSLTAHAAVKQSTAFKMSVTLPEAVGTTEQLLSANFQVREINLRTRSVQYTEIVRNDQKIMLETVVLR